ncbi:S-adenosyl-L-methionine-dependent methyltransferase [Amniculicola lignicola CBS 123094]|uniref:S-adenosyl-L-methionine-dependent methyltransferase n=1 Tax=Amniculicola lignicola CBS 123094 TaxID=1392246 RepID=A0A6A5X131_9PLEO|nr:S-adenosyl-L-methionine-dependent methyltransferase [Amniculicola lignicola CBS 123094]
MKTEATPAAADGGGNVVASTQNTQYDQIGSKYNTMHVLPSVEPERPSVLKALGDIKGLRCLDLACGTGRYTNLLHSLGASLVDGYDISTTMVEGATKAYPPETFSNLRFSVADCSIPLPDPKPEPFDLIFAGWFLNYAGTEKELVSMFNVVKDNLKDGGRFVGITTDGFDPLMHTPKRNFYGIEVEVLDPAYKGPGGSVVLGIKARVITPMIQFDVFQFKSEVYERCAEKAGLVLKWGEHVMPDDERKEAGYWKEWIERPTFQVVHCTKA